MNTEELMKLADAYADAETSYTMSRGEWDPQLRYLSELQLVRDEARAALEAALSAKQKQKQGEQGAVTVTVPQNTLESTYHPCTQILIQGLKRLKAWDVLAEWDKAREIVDKRFSAALSAKQGEQALQDVSDHAPSVNAQEDQKAFAYCYVRKGKRRDLLTFDEKHKDAVKGTMFPLFTHKCPELMRDMVAYDKLLDKLEERHKRIRELEAQNAKTLTNEQIDELWRKSCSLEGFSTAQFVRHFARAAIAAAEGETK